MRLTVSRVRQLLEGVGARKRWLGWLERWLVGR